jgi:Holliday junction resolvase RusA-like endonuclease
MSTHWSDAPPDRVVTMPRPPSTNKLWVRASGKPRVRSAEYSQWLVAAGWEVKRQIVGVPPIDCRFNCVIHVPVSRRDSGNWEKPTLDLCEHVGLVTNDGNAHEINIRPVERDDVMVAIWCLPEMGGIRKAAPSRRASVVRGRTWARAKGTALTWKLP